MDPRIALQLLNTPLYASAPEPIIPRSPGSPEQWEKDNLSGLMPNQKAKVEELQKTHKQWDIKNELKDVAASLLADAKDTSKKASHLVIAADQPHMSFALTPEDGIKVGNKAPRDKEYSYTAVDARTLKAVRQVDVYNHYRGSAINIKAMDLNKDDALNLNIMSGSALVQYGPDTSFVNLAVCCDNQTLYSSGKVGPEIFLKIPARKFKKVDIAETTERVNKESGSVAVECTTLKFGTNKITVSNGRPRDEQFRKANITFILTDDNGEPLKDVKNVPFYRDGMVANTLRIKEALEKPTPDTSPDAPMMPTPVSVARPGTPFLLKGRE